MTFIIGKASSGSLDEWKVYWGIKASGSRAACMGCYGAGMPKA